MASQRLLIGQVEDAQKANAAYTRDADAFNDKAAAFNAHVNGGGQYRIGTQTYDMYGNPARQLQVAPAEIPETVQVYDSETGGYRTEPTGKMLPNPVAGQLIDPMTGQVSTAVAHPGESPEVPKQLNLSQKDIRTLNNPETSGAAGILASAKGYGANTPLQDQASRGSVFANPEDPNNLKERGILARVIGGQL